MSFYTLCEIRERMKLFKLYTNIDTKGKLFKHTEQGYIRMNYFFNQIIPKLEKLSIMQIKITCLQLNKNYKCPFSVRFVKKENNKVYSKIPYGYDRVGDDLVENSKEGKMIRKMMRLRNSGKSYGEIVDYLNRNRYKNKSGNKFSRGNVSWLINSRLKENYSYIG